MRVYNSKTNENLIKSCLGPRTSDFRMIVDVISYNIYDFQIKLVVNVKETWVLTTDQKSKKNQEF